MNTKSIIEIFRGDDSDALGYQTIVGTIHTDLDLTGCKAVFRYLGFFQEFDPIPEDGKLTIVIPSASSMQFPPGFGYASLKVYDIDRKVRTFTNRIPVFVKTMTPCRGGGEFDVEFSPFPELEPLKIFKGPNAEDFDLYTGFISKIIDRASLAKYGLVMLADAMSEDGGATGKAASPAAVKAAYDAIIGVLTDNYYTAAQTDEAIDKLAAYYITSDTQGNPFATHAALVNATTYYSGGSVRIPTRNDYAIVVADETHNNEKWRYIYSENEQGVGQWEPQYAVEGVITFDDNVTRTSGNGVKSSGIWSAIWGALSALPAGFSSLYDWVVSQLAGKANDDAVVKLTGNQDIGGNKTFYGDMEIADGKDLNVIGGRVAVRSQGGSDVALFEYDRLEYSTDGGMTWTSIMLDNIAPLASPAFTGTPTAPTPSSGDDSTKVANTAFVQGAVPYALVTKTITNGAVSLDDRAINAVAVSSSLASLTVNFPIATSGKARDFGLRLTVASGITTAPEIALPQGVTCENADGEAPEIGADGAATILYFTETASGVFLVKGEVVTAIS